MSTSCSRITLVDSTWTDQAPPSDDEEDLRPALSRQRPLTRRGTRSRFREGRAHRKYAKWQEDRYSDMMREGGEASSLSRPQSSAQDQQLSTEPSENVAPEQTETGSTAVEPQAEEAASQTVIDVLYENQRGWFFFGLPLFSDRSLLNLDPPAWMTCSNKESAVDITNAQVPDPSWEWSWKTWYVDMSYDVDEEGWQYSFSFASKFSWHGTHPWFHSFVRRRRWLRQRVKKPVAEDGDRNRRTDDYFTVATATGRSREPSVRQNASQSCYTSGSKFAREEYDAGIPPDEITNIVMLSKAIKLAALDREKIDAVREFVHRGEEELIYLEEKIPDVMSMLLFQTSRRQLLDNLRLWTDGIPKDTSDEAEKGKRDNLVKATRAAEDYVGRGNI